MLFIKDVTSFKKHGNLTESLPQLYQNDVVTTKRI